MSDLCGCLLILLAVFGIYAVIIVPPAVILTRRNKKEAAASTAHPTNVPAEVPSDILLSGGVEHCPGGSPGDAVACLFEPDVSSCPKIY
jgi:hypothetical protein